MFIDKLPEYLEDVTMLMKRRAKAKEKRDLWRSTYRDAFQYSMPSRETFSWHEEGQARNRILFDSTLQEACYTAANTLTALLFPPWMRWAELAPGASVPEDQVSEDIKLGLQNATKTFFGFLNTSNFNTMINECALDLQVGTAALVFDEGDQANPFVFHSEPLSALELEEGPNGTIETTWRHRHPLARNLLRIYDGMQEWDLSDATQKKIHETPDDKISIIQGEIYDPETKKYFGVAIDESAKQIIWRYDYGTSCPMIVGRASKVAGETYGRGRVLLALSDARTLDKMQEFVLTQAALQLAPPLTGVSDGILNPYTANLTPNTIIPVASNDSSNPSLKTIPLGGNFNISEQMMKDLRERVRRTMLGPEPSEGPVKSATEISVADRNRLWAMNGEYNRIQSELIQKVVARGVFILQKKGLMPKFKVNGRDVAVKFTSPFAKTQNADDVMNLERTIQILLPLGPQTIQMGLKMKDIPAYIARMQGIPESLIMTDADREELTKQATAAAQQMNQAQIQSQQQMNAPPPQQQSGPSPTPAQ